MRKFISQWYLLTVWMLLLVSSARAQADLHLDGQQRLFAAHTVKVSGVSAKELYSKAISWLSQKYDNPNQVIRNRQDGAMLAGEAVIPGGARTAAGQRYPVYYTFRMTFAEGGYVIDLRNFRLNNSYKAETFLYTAEGYPKTDENAKLVRESLQEALHQLVKEMESGI